MPDYNTYIENAGISGAAFTQALHAKYPGFTKVQKCMVCQPEKYGVQLLPGAEDALIGTFGDHPGLACRDPRPAAQKKPARKKPNRLVVYLPDDTHRRFRALMERLGYPTVQEMLLAIITRILDIEEQTKKENES